MIVEARSAQEFVMTGSREEAKAHAELAWDAALGRTAGSGGSGSSVALAVARLQDPMMRHLYQEVNELEARVALHSERQVRECRMAARCEADIMKAQAAPEIEAAHNELQSLQARLAEQEQSLKRSSRRFSDMQRQLKKCSLPHEQERLADEREHEASCEAIRESEATLQEQQETDRDLLDIELKQSAMVPPAIVCTPRCSFDATGLSLPIAAMNVSMAIMG